MLRLGISNPEIVVRLELRFVSPRVSASECSEFFWSRSGSEPETLRGGWRFCQNPKPNSFVLTRVTPTFGSVRSIIHLGFAPPSTPFLTRRFSNLYIKPPLSDHDNAAVGFVLKTGQKVVDSGIDATSAVPNPDYSELATLIDDVLVL